MKIVIDIDEDYFRIITKNGASNYTEELIKNGTILPKEHGRLIDADKVISEGISKGFCDWYDEIKNADVLIEANKDDK